MHSISFRELCMLGFWNFLYWIFYDFSWKKKADTYFFSHQEYAPLLAFKKIWMKSCQQNTKKKKKKRKEKRNVKARALKPQ